MYTVNSTGPNIEPCGTPCFRGREAETASIIRTLWLRPDR